jgi:hypothetical protein
MDLLTSLDRLWLNRLWETLLVIQLIAGTNPCLPFAIQDLYRVSDDLGRNFGLLTHNICADQKLTNALRQWVDIALQLIPAILQGLPTEELIMKWTKSASRIARVYHRYHSSIKYRKLNSLLQTLNTLLIDLIQAIKDGNCMSVHDIFNLALLNTYHISDYLRSKF